MKTLKSFSQGDVRAADGRATTKAGSPDEEHRLQRDGQAAPAQGAVSLRGGHCQAPQGRG